MQIKIQYILNNNFLLKKYLRENSYYYKDLVRNPEFITKLNELMKKDYNLTFPAKLDKIKEDISLLNTFVDVLK